MSVRRIVHHEISEMRYLYSFHSQLIQKVNYSNLLGTNGFAVLCDLDLLSAEVITLLKIAWLSACYVNRRENRLRY